MKRIRQKCLALVSALNAGLVIALLGGGLIMDMERQHQQKSLDEIMWFANEVVTDVGQALNLLNTGQIRGCSPAALTNMQRILFASRFLKEVAYTPENQVLCTTSTGVLNPPRPVLSPTFDTGRGIRIHLDQPVALFEDLPEQPSLLIAASGDFNVIIERNYIDMFNIPAKRWELLHNKQAAHHMHGTPGVFNPDFTGSQAQGFRLFGGLYMHTCNTNTGYCAATVTHTWELLAKYSYLLAFTLLLALGSANLLYLYLSPNKGKSSSLKYRIRNGLANGSFYTAYQPIVALRDESLVGCEVLSRFRDNQGRITPDQFIPFIKALRATWSFTLSQLKRAIDELASAELPPGFKISFNVFPEDLTPAHTHELISLLKPWQHKFVFNVEIIEHKVLDQKSAQAMITLLSEHGVMISVDDFGTGYSNLGQLSHLRCDILKIDRSFISDMENGALISTLVPQIRDIANQLQLQCVAEGVENQTQMGLCRAQGIEYGQGWYFGRPMSLTKWRKYLEKRVEQNMKQAANF